jgi:hypothetical protein
MADGSCPKLPSFKCNNPHHCEPIQYVIGKQQRAKRPGQAPPNPRARHAAQRDDQPDDDTEQPDEYTGADDDALDAEPANLHAANSGSQPGKGQSELAQRRAEQDAAWARQRPQAQAQLIECALSHHVDRESTRASHVEGMQTRYRQRQGGWMLTHPCTADGQRCEATAPLGHVKYIGLTASGVMQLSVVTCCECAASYQPTAIEAGCFPSSPDYPDVWYDLDVHTAYSRLGLRSGLSSTGVRREMACNDSHAPMPRLPTPHASG